MLIILIGPKGSGKSHIGRILEKRLGVHFFHVEPLWMDYYAECERLGKEPLISEGIEKVHPRIAEALREHENVCVETTGASAEILDALLSLGRATELFLVRIHAPVELCLQRIACRDQMNQIPMDLDSIRKVHELSESMQLQANIEIENDHPTEDEIVALFKSVGG
jgi:shikimate kinase